MEEKSTLFDRNYSLIYFLLLVLGIFLRVYDLDLRPIHHDESLYALYSYHFFDDPLNKFYKYNPLLHGPFLFNIFPWFFESFGVSHQSARLPIALIGSLMLLLPYFFKDKLGKRLTLLLLVFVSLSPSHIYWSRFLRHDFFALSTLILSLISFYFFPPRFKGPSIFVFLTLHACIKENLYVLLAILLGYSLFSTLFFKAKHFSRFFLNIKKYPVEWLLGLSLSILLFCYFYSSGFVYPKGILDGLYRETFSYWFNQHNIERIKGPFSFQFFFMSWYEPWFVLFTLIHWVHFYWQNKREFKIVGILSLILGFVFYLIYRETLLEAHPLWGFLKFKIPFDILVFFFLVPHAVNLTIYHLKKGEQEQAFFGYLFFASFFTYSYLGEKVPWLSLYILLPGVIYLCLYFRFLLSYQFEIKKILISLTLFSLFLNIIFLIQGETYSQFSTPFHLSLILLLSYAMFQMLYPDKKINLYPIVFVLVLASNLRWSLLTNFGKVNQSSEIIRQVHTSKEAHDIVENLVRNEALHLSHEKSILVRRTAVWPFAWYFHSTPSYTHLLPANKKLSDFNHLFDDFSHLDEYKEILETHEKIRLPLRSWWVPQYSNLSLKNFLIYTIFHRPWNPPGDYQILYFKRKNLKDG